MLGKFYLLEWFLWLLVFDFICVPLCLCKCVSAVCGAVDVCVFRTVWSFALSFVILFSSSTSEDGWISYQWLLLEWSTAKSQVRLVSHVTKFDIRSS